jgi:hypothetical protein
VAIVQDPALGAIGSRARAGLTAMVGAVQRSSEKETIVSTIKSKIVKYPAVVQAALRLDSLQPRLGEDRVTGAMISRTTIGEKYYYNLDKLKPDPSITGMLDAAQLQCGNKRNQFITLLTNFLTERCSKDDGFDAACDGVIDHLVARRALVRTIDGFPKQSVLFIDTGYRTFPAFLAALVGLKCGDNVDAHMFYCAVDPASQTATRFYRSPATTQDHAGEAVILSDGCRSIAQRAIECSRR